MLVTLCITILVASSLVTVNVVDSAESPTVSITGSDLYSSCTSLETTPLLPNLSYAKASVQFSAESTCDGIYRKDTKRTIKWYYYSKTQPPPTDCEPSVSCCHNVATSTIEFKTTTVAGVIGGNAVITRKGTVSDGAHIGKDVTRTITTVSPTGVSACTSEEGLEAATGAATLEIVGGPTCVGVSITSFCPGLKLL